QQCRHETPDLPMFDGHNRELAAPSKPNSPCGGGGLRGRSGPAGRRMAHTPGRGVNMSLDRPETAPESDAGHLRVARQKDTRRSKVANGTALWAGIDGRSLWARRAGELLAAHLSDLGGADNCSEAEHALAKRAAVLVTELKRREAGFAQSGAVSDEALAIYQ